MSLPFLHSSFGQTGCHHKNEPFCFHYISAPKHNTAAHTDWGTRSPFAHAKAVNSNFMAIPSGRMSPERGERER